MTGTTIVVQLGFVVVLVIAASSAAWLLRRARVAGSAVMGGLLVGLFLGPGLMGRLAPDWYEEHLIGARETRITADNAFAEAEATALAARTFGITPTNARDIHFEQLLRAEQARADWRAERDRHQAPLRWSVVILTIGFALCAPGRRRAPLNLLLNEPDFLTLAASTGLWMSVIAAGGTAVVLTWFDHDLAIALLAGACAGCGTTVIHPWDARSARETDPLAARFMRAALLISLLVASMLFVAIGFNLRGGSVFIETAALPLAILCGLARPLHARVFPRIASTILLPGVTALAATVIEVFQHTGILLPILCTLIAGDGRWLGAWIGAGVIGGRTTGGWRALRFTMPVMSTGPMQVVFIALAAWMRLLPETIIFALLIAAAYMEASLPLRRSMNRTITSLAAPPNAETP